MAGQAKQKFGAQVEVEVIYGRSESGPEPPNIAVNGELLGDKPTQDELEMVIYDEI